MTDASHVLSTGEKPYSTTDKTMRITLVGSRHFGATTFDMLRQRGVDIARVVVADGEDRLANAARAAGIEVTVQADRRLVVASEIAEGTDLIVTAHSHARISKEALATATLPVMLSITLSKDLDRAAVFLRAPVLRRGPLLRARPPAAVFRAPGRGRFVPAMFTTEPFSFSISSSRFVAARRLSFPGLCGPRAITGRDFFNSSWMDRFRGPARHSRLRPPGWKPTQSSTFLADIS